MKAIDDPVIGDVVYEAYRPQRPGKIIAIEDSVTRLGDHRLQLAIKWIDGSISRDRTIYQLSRLSDLIADHEKKLNTHKKTLAKALIEINVEEE